MDDHTFQVLEFDKVLALVSEFADSAAASEEIRALRPLRDVVSAREELELVSQARLLLEKGVSLPPLTVPATIQSLGRLDVEGCLLSVGELTGISFVIAAYTRTEKILRKECDTSKTLYSILKGIAPDPQLAVMIDRAIDPETGVREDASKKLLKLSHDLRKSRDRIFKDLEAKQKELGGNISTEASITLRNGRYVVPIRVDSRNRVKGIIHDKSRSGQTIFLEPDSIVESNNLLKEIEMEIEREKERILRELSDSAVANREGIHHAYRALVRLDSILARARCSIAWDCNEPVLMPNGNDGLRIIDGRHPLLMKRLRDDGREDALVPLVLEFEEDEKTLLISGPNAGGKTVVLKTVGLLTLMSLAGLHIPAQAGTVIPFPNGVYVDIGDDQSIENDLSTFSSHIGKLVEILNNAGQGTLVLLDEIGVGTDPAEGIVIARAALEVLNEKASRTIATTHYSHLKGLADATRGIKNASLSFDSDNLEPTFHFSKGLPGRSMGISIGERLGLPASVISRAKSYLDDEGMALEDLLAELEQLKRSILDEREELRRKTLEMDEAISRLQEETKSFKRRSREVVREAKEESRKAYLEARKELEDAIRKLEGKGDREEVIREARRRLERGLRSISESIVPPSSDAIDYIPRVGDEVVLPGLSGTATVTGVAVDRGEVEVEVAGKSLRIGLESIVPCEASGSNGKNTSGAGSGGGLIRTDVVSDDTIDEIDIRGCTREEVGYELSKAIDAAILHGLTVLRIIHGKGTGVLREEVGRTLKMDRRIRGFRMGRPWEGGSGVTIVEVVE